MKLEVWTARHVAEYLVMDERTVTYKATKGQIPGVKIGSMWRFSRRKIMALIEGDC